MSNTLNGTVATEGTIKGTVANNMPISIDAIVKKAIGSINRKTFITLFADKWETIEERRHIQVIDVPTVTSESELRIDITPEQALIFSQKDITFIVGNDNGVVTVECIGQKPTNDYTIQLKITEVNII